MAGACAVSSGSLHNHDKVVTAMQEGNSRRKTESTDANAASSRSHAILEVTVCRSDRNHYQKQVGCALCLQAGNSRDAVW